MRSFRFEYRNRPFEVRFGSDRAVELCLDGVVRKRRLPSGKAPMYLWTNVELQWEEHHFVEVRYWPRIGRLLITVNGNPIHDEVLPASGGTE
ncbi:MAG: hypothetical protein OXP09_22440 [Gammaproteobacteria bacterium]|nr:hypothetical protein [Gammaproteobacteria bacterium]MDE0368315.1 hypothetical protein [Gammaproteobacteria bacterium]